MKNTTLSISPDIFSLSYSQEHEGGGKEARSIRRRVREEQKVAVINGQHARTPKRVSAPRAQCKAFANGGAFMYLSHQTLYLLSPNRS